jgi:hypothetical protein
VSTFCQAQTGVIICRVWLDSLWIFILIAFEVAFLFIAGLVAIVTIAAMGRPLAEAYAEKLKTKYRAIGSEQASSLQLRLESLENEVRDLKSQLKNVQESTEFAVKLIEKGDVKTLKKLPEKQQ